jgi:hypothetical protein
MVQPSLHRVPKVPISDAILRHYRSMWNNYTKPSLEKVTGTHTKRRIIAITRALWGSRDRKAADKQLQLAVQPSS